MVRQKNQLINRNNKKPILIDLSYTENKSPKPIVIFCHGYKGFKDWGCWNLVAETFEKAGFFFVKFNFSHNGGTISQPIDFLDLEAFANNNYTTELNDLGDVIDWVLQSKQEFSKDIQAANICLIGHSRGGGIVSLKANEDSRITQLITWAGVSNFKLRFPQGEQFELWKKTGVYHVINGRTKQQMPHYYQFYTDFVENEKRLNIENALKSNKTPHLIIHGTTDEAVSFEEAKELHNWNPDSCLLPIENANHVFGGKHPWEGNTLPKDLEIVCNESIRFLQQQIPS